MCMASTSQSCMVRRRLLERLARLDGLNAPHLSLANKIMAQAYDISAYKIAADELLLSSGVKFCFTPLESAW